MALDAQSNWNIEMTKPRQILQSIPASTVPKISSSSSSISISQKCYNRHELDLPIEILEQILAYVPQTSQFQYTLWSCCLVSRAWYSASIASLYEWPHLSGSNFQSFVATVCPSKNAHILRSPLSVFVKRLDMGDLVHDSSRSLTARLLGRLKGNITSFVAPQASFSINSFAALSKCTQLTYLDMSLMSTSIPIRSLFRTLKALKELRTLFFPRTSIREEAEGECEWPPALRALHLAGGIDDHFLYSHLSAIPESLKILSIQHCSQIHSAALQDFLLRKGSQLKELTIRYPMSKLPASALNHTFTSCPNITALRISADYITDALFDEANIPFGHPLRILDLDCSTMAPQNIDVSPDGIWLAIQVGNLSNLRSIRVSSMLAWQATSSLRSSVSDLVEIMEQEEQKNPTGVEPGVWMFAPS